MRCKVLLVLLPLLTLGGCDPILGAFLVPPQVWTGQVFEVVVTGHTDSQPGGVGATLQLPNGFTAEDGVADYAGGSGRGAIHFGRPVPSTQTAIAAEPGHFTLDFFGSDMNVIGLSGGGAGVQLKVYVHAPPAMGAFTLKVVLWGTSGLVPAGVTSFAQITTAPHAQPITIVGNPVGPFYPQPIQLTSGVPVWNRGVALADIDGDGLDDLGCGVSGGPSATGLPVGTYVWLNRGDAPWPSPLPLPLSGPGYGRVAFGDFDGDGHKDLADTVGRVFFGDGGTSWAPGPALPFLQYAWSGVAVGDIDGDGRDDVAFSATNTDAIQVLHSQSNRTFADWSQGLPNSTSGTAGADRLALADFSGDGHCDLIAAGAISLRAWTGDGQGHWQPASNGLPPAHVFGLGDFDGDGHPDIVTVGVGGLLEVYVFTAGSWVQRAMPGSVVLPFPTAIAVLDYDRDGWPDVVVAASIGYSSLFLFRNLGGQSFAQPVQLSFSFYYGAVDLAVGDVDGDSWPDLVAAIPGEEPILWRNTGSGLSSFGNACGATGFPTPATTGSGQPQLGNANFAVELHGASPGGLGLIWLGVSRRFAFGAPLLPYDLAPLGAPGCAVVASPEALFLMAADPLGSARLPLPVPNDPNLRRVVLFAQAAAAAPGANALGWLFANGLALKVP